MVLESRFAGTVPSSFLDVCRALGLCAVSWHERQSLLGLRPRRFLFSSASRRVYPRQ